MVERPHRDGIDWWWAATTVPITAVYALFAVSHFMMWLETREFHGVGLVLHETLLVALFITRRRPLTSSASPLAWLAAWTGGFGILVLRPGSEAVGGLEAAWASLQFVGILGSVLSLGFLGRSFGIVAANRGVRTSGPYRLVRHPAYASYAIANVAYALENPTPLNFAIVIMTTVAQLVRIKYEEDTLASDPAYAAYRARVRYRLIPGLY